MKAKRSPRTVQGHRVSDFARRFLLEWRKLRLPLGKEVVIVGVSGGADSTAMLLALEELIRAHKISLEIIVAHLDHGIRTTSKSDARWVKNLAKQLGYSAVISHVKAQEVAATNKENLEQTARKLRYSFFERTARRKKSRYVLTGHTMDDQAETVLLRLMRGSASLGLSGIEGIRPLSERSDVQLVRPLLFARREETEGYCLHRHQNFLHDEMNADETFARVKVRKQLVPLMESFNTRVVEAISRAATMLREDSSWLYENAEDLLKKASMPAEDGNNKTQTSTLDVQVLSRAPAALRRRALRQWISKARGNAHRLEMVHLVAVERLLEGKTGGRVVELPNGGRVTRRRGRLLYDVKND